MTQSHVYYTKFSSIANQLNATITMSQPFAHIYIYETTSGLISILHCHIIYYFHFIYIYAKSTS